MVSGCWRRATFRNTGRCASFGVGTWRISRRCSWRWFVWRRRLGLARLGKLSIDGTKVRANASKRKAMSYDRMQEEEQRLESEIEALLRQADAVDEAEDSRLGAEVRGDDLPAELRRREARLAAIREAKARLEAAARAADDARGRQPGQDRNPKGGRPYKRAYGEPDEKAQILLGGSAGPVVRDVPGSDGLQIHVAERPLEAAGLTGTDLAAGTRSVSCFLVNRRRPAEAQPDRAYAFQAEIEVRTDEGFVPRPDLRGAHGGDWDDRVADLHYADTPEYATGHGVSAEWEFVDGECRSIRTAWVGTAEVEKTATADVPGVDLSMEALGRLDDGTTTQQALGPLVVQYREWIEARRQEVAAGPGQGDRRDTAEQLLHCAGIAAERMARGVALLGEDADLLDAFRVANRAVARALRQRLGEKDGPDGPRWRPFQLAFLLLNLPGLADPHDVHRETVDLLFFPTGGGKTEAYLGLAAVAMVLRRLRHPGDDGLAGAGVSVIMRYTLRLLTLDQLARAAGLICALEIERTEAGERYGTWPFEIGLWVGKAATPTSWGARGMAGQIPRARRSRRSSAIRTGIRLRSRSRTVLGARRASSPSRSRCCRTPMARVSCASSARTTSASSAETARCRSSAWTSLSTGGCRRF